MQLVFFLEEPSARAMLQGLLPRILPEYVGTQFVVFEGKKDLDKRLPMRLRAWQNPDARFIVLRDQDRSNCFALKQVLHDQCRQAGNADVLVRIACRELEAFYLGDLTAVATALGPRNIDRLQNRAKYRTPDRLANAAQELKYLAPSYQKLAGSRAIAPQLDFNANRSNSFNVLIDGIRRLVA